MAVDASTIAVFKDSIDDSVNFLGRPSADEIERAVTVHEAGHLLGLVNLVYQSPIPHEDPDHPGHSNNEDSVMYWAIESQDIGNQLDGEPPNNFDEYDLDDLSLLKQGKL